MINIGKCQTVRKGSIAHNGFGLGEEWEFEKLQFGAKHYVSPFFAKPMLYAVGQWRFCRFIENMSLGKRKIRTAEVKRLSYL